MVLGSIDQKLIWISMAGLLVVVTMVRPLDSLLAKLTDRIFFRERYRYQQTLKAASAGMGRIRSLPKLLTMTARVIVNSVKVSHATIFLKQQNQPYFSVVASRGQLKKPVGLFRLDQSSPVVHWLQDRQEPIVYEELKAKLKQMESHYAESANQQTAVHLRLLSQVTQEMERMQVEVCVPSLANHKLIGIFMLGEKLSGDMYNQEDLDTFSTLANQAALAIENAQAYDELLHTRDQLLQSQRLATIGKFASDMAHEIKNPLQAIMTFFEYFPERHNDPDFRDRFAKTAHAEAQRINQLVRDLVTYSRPRPPAFGATDMDQTIQSVLDLLENDLRKNQVTLKKRSATDPMIIEADRDQMKQVFLNLILNALDAMPPEKASQRHQLEITLLPTPRVTQIEIKDSGCGIPTSHLSALFTPFFTTKEKGSGLGLSIVQNIIQAHHGSIEISSEPGEGTTLTLRLPNQQPQSATASSHAA